VSRKKRASAHQGSEFVPHFNRSVLRDHADPERVDRVWERIERDLVLEAPAPAPAAGKPAWRFPQAAAGIAAGFALGLGLAGWLARGDDPDAVVMEPAPLESSLPEVLAAGTAPRTYPLPGGGVITLEPGTIVDTLRDGRGRVSLRLVRGEATVTTRDRAVGSERLALFIGEAEVDAAGQMQVRHDGDTAYLRVLAGSASVRAPHRDKGRERLVLGPDQEARVPVRIVTARVEDAPRRPRVGPDDGHDDEPAPLLEDEAPIVVSSPPAWMMACDRSDFAGAVEALRQDGASPGNDPKYLMCLASGHRERNDDQAAVGVLERVAGGRSDDPNKMLATRDLVRIHERLGNHEKAKQYAEELNRMSSGGLLLTAEALCNKIVQSHQAGRAQDVLNYAGRYRQQFPDGACTETIDKILAQLEKVEPREDVYEELDDGEAGPTAP
jgi:hypothetical protein